MNQGQKGPKFMTKKLITVSLLSLLLTTASSQAYVREGRSYQRGHGPFEGIPTISNTDGLECTTAGQAGLTGRRFYNAGREGYSVCRFQAHDKIWYHPQKQHLRWLDGCHNRIVVIDDEPAAAVDAPSEIAPAYEPAPTESRFAGASDWFGANVVAPVLTGLASGFQFGEFGGGYGGGGYFPPVERIIEREYIEVREHSHGDQKAQQPINLTVNVKNKNTNTSLNENNNANNNHVAVGATSGQGTPNPRPPYTPPTTTPPGHTPGPRPPNRPSEQPTLHDKLVASDNGSGLVFREGDLTADPNGARRHERSDRHERLELDDRGDSYRVRMDRRQDRGHDNLSLASAEGRGSGRNALRNERRQLDDAVLRTSSPVVDQPRSAPRNLRRNDSAPVARSINHAPVQHRVAARPRIAQHRVAAMPRMSRARPQTMRRPAAAHHRKVSKPSGGHFKPAKRAGGGGGKRGGGKRR